MKKVLFLVILSMAFVFRANSQFFVPKQKLVADIENKQLVVQLFETDDKVERKLKGEPDKLKEYLKFIDLRNRVLRLSFESYWKLNKDIQFLTPAEIEANINNSENVVIYYEEWSYNQVAELSTMGETDKTPTRRAEGYFLKMRNAEDKLDFFRVTLPNDMLNEGDYKFILHQFEKFIKSGMQGKNKRDRSLYDVQRNLSIIGSKTMVVSQTSLGKISNEKAIGYYSNKMQIATNDHIDSLIIQGDTQTLYVTEVWSNNKNQWMTAIVDVATQDIVALYLLGEGIYSNYKTRIGLGKEGYISNNQLISFRSRLILSKTHFKNMTSKIQVKMNY
ncbi:MAG: hypothetical protein COW63_09910 [Bacteroidetes bacterium CG18_big_fil_WC_8_21_14_2_50_41_14]|nr:MAG: hypothetical protein COW63_09910 [Bacteroidetes bacterium CG18_big_fil_WC_8_21_14_2_50_41_14]